MYNLPFPMARAFLLAWLHYKTRGVTGDSFVFTHGDLAEIPSNRRAIVTVRIEDIEQDMDIFEGEGVA